MQRIILIFICCLTAVTNAQEVEISGKLVDSISHQPLESATVFLTKIADTSLLAYTLSDEKGDFLLKAKTKDEIINLNIGYVGYKSFSDSVIIDNKDLINLDSIYLPAKVEGLKEVLIKGVTPPIVFKNDTIEFNVASFKADNNTYLEDFLKILPGFQIKSNGNITFNGKPVDKVMVNGKRFFDDPKLATQNFSKGLIEKIQVLDSRSQTQVFTGEKSEGKSKTINLEIAKENNKGYFGNLSTAAGTKERYEVNGMGNYFNDEMRLSVVASANNNNSSNQSFSGTVGYMGPQNFGGGGINRSQNISSNFVDEWSDKLDFNGNYNFKNEDNINEQKLNSENRLPNNRIFLNQSLQSNTSKSQTHRFQTQFEATLDSVYFIQFRPSFTFSESYAARSKSQQSLDENRELRNTSESSNNSKGFNRDYSNNLTATRKYGKNGGFIQFSGRFNVADNELDIENRSETNFFTGRQAIDSTLTRNQFRDGNQNNISQDYTLKWKIPLNDYLSLTPSYNYSSEKRKNKILIYDKEQDDSVLNIRQSTDYKNFNYEHRAGLELRYFKEKIQAAITVKPVVRYLRSTESFNSIDFSNKYSALELSSTIGYKLNNSSGLNLVYELGNQVPGIMQLSPFVDETDPLHIRTGNPDLKPISTNIIQLNYNSFKIEDNSNLIFSSRLTVINDAVINKTTIGENLIRNSTFVNVDGNYNLNLNGAYRKRVKLDSVKNLTYTFQPMLSIDSQINSINGEFYRSINNTISPSAILSYYRDIRQQYTITYNPRFGSNSFTSKTLEDSKFVTHNISFSGNTKILKLYIRNDLRYTYNSNIGENFSKNSISWNAGLRYNILDKKGTITLDAFDILNQNNNANRYSSGESVIDVESSIIRRYFMLGFRYNFNTMGGGKAPKTFSILR